MKTIQNVKTQEVKRESDEVARKAVASGKFVYVPKSAWKNQAKNQ